MSIKKALTEEFNNELGGLRGLTPGSTEHKTALDEVTKIADRIIELEKIEVDREIKIYNQETEKELKTRQMEDEDRDRKDRNKIEVGKVVLGLGFATWAFVASTNFEKVGTLTTPGGRKALDSLLKFVRF